MKKTLKNNKQALIAGLVLIALVIAYFKRDQIKDFFSKSDKSPSNNAATTVSNTTSEPSTLSENDIVLKKGSSGKQVRKLQQLLNDHHRQNKPTFIPTLVEDEKFGALTEAMLKKYTGKTSISINQLLKALT
jgi:hypothetical protein